MGIMWIMLFMGTNYFYYLLMGTWTGHLWEHEGANYFYYLLMGTWTGHLWEHEGANYIYYYYYLFYIKKKLNYPTPKILLMCRSEVKFFTFILIGANTKDITFRVCAGQSSNFLHLFYLGPTPKILLVGYVQVRGLGSGVMGGWVKHGPGQHSDFTLQ